MPPRLVHRSHLIPVNSHSLAQEVCQSAGKRSEQRNSPCRKKTKGNSFRKPPDSDTAALHWCAHLLLETWNFVCSSRSRSRSVMLLSSVYCTIQVMLSMVNEKNERAAGPRPCCSLLSLCFIWCVCVLRGQTPCA